MATLHSITTQIVHDCFLERYHIVIRERKIPRCVEFDFGKIILIRYDRNYDNDPEWVLVEK